MAVTPYTERFTIYTFQEDATGAATVQSLCDYMQEAAGNHAALLGVSIEKLHSEGAAWVLARMRVVPEKLPRVHDAITVTTWPVGVEGLQYRRDFLVRDGAGNTLARAVSHWVVVSFATRKVGRIPAFIAGIPLNNAQTVMRDEKRRLPEVAGGNEAAVFTARLSDIDRNLHVNNVRYMDWIVESVPSAVRETSSLADIEIVYKAEACHGDTIVARTAEAPGENDASLLSSAGKTFNHSLAREADARELARAQSVWRRHAP